MQFHPGVSVSLWWFWHARATQPTEECGKSTQAWVQIYTRSRDGQEEKNKRKKRKKREKREDRRDDGIISSGKAGNVHRVNIGDRIGNCVGMFNEGVGKCHAVKMSEQHPSNRMLPTLAPTYCRCIVHQVTLSRFRVIFTLMGIEGRTVRYVKKAFSYSHPLFFNGVPCWWKMVSFLGREFSLREFIFFVFLEFSIFFSFDNRL